MKYKYNLPELSYGFGDLEPHIDAKTMEVHHTKHHQGYVDKLNKALEGHDDLQSKALVELLGNLDSLPEEIRTTVRNNGGGHANHSLFWFTMSADGGGDPKGNIAGAIESAFGNFDSFKEKFTQTATGVFGSGWAWLSKDKSDNLRLDGLPNQDSPLMHGHTPILGLDVWEHAYYLNYQNRRPDYIEAWWNVVDWEAVERRF